MKRLKLFYVVFLLLPFTLFIFTCTPTEPDENLTLSIEDASCTEAWLKVKGVSGSEVILKRDDKEVKRFNLTGSETVVMDDSLLPNKTYTYQAINNDKNSSKLTLTTLDTTSHNFTWQTWIFGGERGSSILYDVAVINENNIWAVGEIYTKESYTYDSLGNWINPYNAIHWDGDKWELKRINFSYKILNPNSSGDTIGFSPIKSIFAFNEKDIWIAAGTVQHWDGTEWHQFRGEYAGFSNKIWGTNSSNLYFVGGNGTIIHYQNGQWQKIESGTELSFQDIWGDKDEILAVASEKFSTGGKYLVRIDGNSAVHLDDIITTAVSLSGIWFIADRRYYLVGDGIYSKNSLDENRWRIDSIIFKIKYYPYSISGNALNDVALCSEGSTIAHFNGMNWMIHSENSSYDRLRSIKMKKDLIVSVGERFTNTLHNQAVIYMGRR